MKVVILCLLFAVGELNANNVHLTGAQKEIATKLSAECAKESGVKPAVLAEADKGQYTDDGGLKKFIYCFFQKSGVITPDSKLNVDDAIAKLPPGVDKAEATKILEQCKNKSGKDAVDTSYEIFKCYNSGVSTHVLL
uniref:Antennal binding protein 7 n=1 Tax=Antheraea yamamai TaxID=7121 RepID=E3UPD2_ANTYA|nr:antennal binding protein 7 [Antheraea yamamai]